MSVRLQYDSLQMTCDLHALLQVMIMYLSPGFMLGNLQEEHHSHLNMGTITKGKVKKIPSFPSKIRSHSVRLLILIICVCSFTGLVMLLQDPDPVVRVKAAEAMGHFH